MELNYGIRINVYDEFAKPVIYDPAFFCINKFCKHLETSQRGIAVTRLLDECRKIMARGNK